MNAVELTTPEFAFLLATLDCTEVVGLEDPSLFPNTASAKAKLYKAGRKSLEENGWIRPIPESSEDFELDAHLLEAVSVIAAPEYLTAGIHADGESEPLLVLHYFAEDDIVELSATEKKLYWVSMLENQGDVIDRIAQLMHLEPPSRDCEFELEVEVLEEVIAFIERGKLSEAETRLQSLDFEPEDASALVSALASQARGSQITITIEAGEIVSGRRFHVYGSGTSAWMTYAPEPSSSSIIIRPCSKGTIDEFITDSVSR